MAGVLIVSGLSVGTSVFAPWFLGPAAFGTFTLLTSLFQYATKADLGLSQLADRKLAVNNSAELDCAANILRSRLIIGSIVLGLIVPIAMWVAWVTGRLPVTGTALAIAAGGAFMIATGPVTVSRATSKVWEFTTAALLLHAGLTVPRLAGLAFGGVTGCFMALALWYGALAALLSRTVPPTAAAGVTPILPLLQLALPLFAFNAVWEIYLSARTAGIRRDRHRPTIGLSRFSVRSRLDRDRHVRHNRTGARTQDPTIGETFTGACWFESVEREESSCVCPLGWGGVGDHRDRANDRDSRCSRRIPRGRFGHEGACHSCVRSASSLRAFRS